MLNINMDDVYTVLNSCAPYLIAFAIVLVVAIVAMVFCRKLEKKKKKIIRGEATIAIIVTLCIVVNLILTGPVYTMVNLVLGDNNGTISEESIESATELNVELAEEGIVLLKNEDSTLPLESGAKLNVFGWSSTNPVYGGTGSGSISANYDTVDILESLEAAGFELNTTISDFYTEWRTDRPEIGMFEQDWTIPEPTMEEYDEAGIFESAEEFSDTAVIVLSRCGGEGADLPTSYTEDCTTQSDDADASKTYLEPSNRELELIDRVATTFDNVIVIINSSNMMELGWVDDYDSIQSVILCPGAGQEGFTALGEILNGTVNPSGKTADTIVYDLTTTPTFNNFGNYVYTNMTEYTASSSSGDSSPTFVNYVEGIYVGYKFYETADDEGLIDYDTTVQYPFGYGLSYTTFTQEMGTMTVEDGVITFDVTVTNTGTVAGKDVVEVYYNPPYTNGGIEKASANLVEYAKTDELQPGESQTITISFDVEDMVSFDTYGYGCYVLEAGDYEISINSDAHTVLDSQTYTVDETIVYDEDNPRSSDSTAATVQFADAEGDVTYLSRADGFANYDEATAAPTSYELDEDLKAQYINNSNYDPEDYNDDSDEMPTTGADNGVELVDLVGLDYDDPLWDDLLDELTVSDMNTLIANGGYSTAAVDSIGKVQTIDCDGPASINNNFTSESSIGFPAAVMIACTWNKDLAYDFGESIGTMADEMGVSGWYAPAVNIHRSAFAGRNFEYYSEDSVLSGYTAAAAAQGAESKGVYSYVKHFALNDQETNRYNQLFTWANEQSIREIYLKSFEITIKDGGADAVMSSYNFIGTTPAQADSALLNTVLRDEWGFQGMVVSDMWGGFGYQDADRMMRNGTDLMLSPFESETNNVDDQTSATSVQAMRTACHNILYTTVNSRAYYDENLNPGTETWIKVMIAIDVLIGLAMAAWEVVLIRNYRKKSSEE
ncbi:MAG: glycoside hydrolase family 3 C-terminal domain-containing protein [Clostridiales bacterium]|nr:glycoside hydrolase family 3 C-terminal domain-containing protein [Clostridiales bacterium]